MEEINQIKLIDKELYFFIKSGGNNSYQYVYREGKGLYWVPELGAFKCVKEIHLDTLEMFKQLINVLIDDYKSFKFSKDVNFEGINQNIINQMKSEF